MSVDNLNRKMLITRDTTTTLKPRTYEELFKRTHRPYSNNQWGLRKPIGIYNVSYTNILECFEAVLDELEIVLQKQAFRDIPPTRWDKALVKAQKSLLLRLMEHFDDCFNILCCFFPGPDNNLDVKDLNRAKSIVRKDVHVLNALNAVREYREHVARIANHIKHHQGMLRGVAIFNEDVAVHGYFVEHINQDEVLEPHPEVHQNYNGAATAFSLNRDLRYLLWLLYAVGEHVAEAISQVEPDTTQHQYVTAGEENIVDLVSRVATLPTQVYKDEENLPYPRIAIEMDNGITKLTLEYPSKDSILIPLEGKYRIATGFVGDGVTRSIRLPYFMNG